MRRLFALLFVLTLLPFSAHADAIPDGYHGVDICLTVDNINDFPDYYFFLNTTTNTRFPATKQLNESESCDVDGTSTFIAVKQTNYPKLNMDSSTPEHSGDDWEYRDWASWPENAAYILPSALTLDLEKYIPDTDPTESRDIVIHINAVSDKAVDASITQDKKLDKKGKLVDEGEASNKNTPYADPPPDDIYQGRGKTSWPVNEILVACLGVLGLVLAYRSWKK